MAEKRAQPDQAGDPARGASFVDQIVTDPRNVPDVMLLYGYLGASSEDEHERLYLSPDLVNYVEIPASAILHRMAMPKEQDANGGVTLWVRKDAALISKLAPAAQALAHYFAGAIQGQGVAPARPAPPLTFGGPACGVTLPHICQIATAVCTRNTCGVACTAAGPCLTQAADCQTQAATCACTEFGCHTDVTPCINTHIVTCGPCHQTIGCQSAGADCTFIGCGHTLACTQGLLCRAAAPTVGGPQCGGTQPHVCQVASLACTAFTPCLTQVATCAPFCTPNCRTPLVPCVTIATCQPTCAPYCTPNCRTPLVPCVTMATCAIHCTIAGPACNTQLCQLETAACPQVTPACPPVSLACGMGMQGQAGGFAAHARALPTMWAHCTQVCTQMQMGCGGPGCPGGTIM